MAAVLVLWAASCCCSLRLTFGVVPHKYIVEAFKGTLSIERWFACVKAEWPRIEVEPSAAFDRQFYEEWWRASEQKQFCGVFTCEMGTVISPEAAALEPTLVVTPGSLVAIPYWLLLGASCLPLAVCTAWFYFRRRSTYQ